MKQTLQITLFLLLSVLTTMTAIVANAQELPETSTGWTKYENNQVIDGKKYGTCFDIAMLKEDGLYKMWFSWRPKESIAYCESKEGVNWSEPAIVLSPAKNDWEKILNRIAIYKKDGVYHLWYTGQVLGKPNERSQIGYAVSNDGLKFERKSERPVL